jgi:hypothetical protein
VLVLKLARDLAIAQSIRHQRDHLFLARRQQLHPARIYCGERRNLI